MKIKANNINTKIQQNHEDAVQAGNNMTFNLNIKPKKLPINHTKNKLLCVINL